MLKEAQNVLSLDILFPIIFQSHINSLYILHW